MCVCACVLGSSHYVAGVKEMWNGHVTLLNDTSVSGKYKNTFSFLFDMWPTIQHELHTTRINLLKTKRRLLNLNAQSVPRCKHFISVIKTNQFMV